MKTLLKISLLFILIGCSAKPDTVSPTQYLKCKIPDVPKAELEQIPDTPNYAEKVQVILNNCLLIQKENELLRKAIEVCK